MMKLSSYLNIRVLFRWLSFNHHHLNTRSCHTQRHAISWMAMKKYFSLGPRRQMSSSVLYPGHFREGAVSLIEVDLNLKQRFRNVRALFENVRARNMSEKVNVYHLASMYKTLMEVDKKRIEIEEEKQQNADQMKRLLKMAQTDSVWRQKEELIAHGKEIRERVREVNKYYYELEEEVILYALQLPTDLHRSTPQVEDKIVREMGSIKTDSSRKAVGHMLIGRKTGTIFRKNVGPVQCYLRKNVADLEQEISFQVGARLRQLGFTQMSCPDMVKTIIIEGTGLDVMEPEQAYVIQDKKIEEDTKDDVLTNKTFYLVGASPQSFAAGVTQMNFLEDCLPQRWFSIQRSYNPARNIPGAGLFSVPQCNVVELFGIAKDEPSASALYEDFQRTVWSLYEVFSDQMPIRAIARSAQHLLPSEAGRVDIEAWSYSLQQFVTVGSVSLWSDFLSRRLMTMWSSNINRLERGHFVHTVHGTAVNITTLVGLLMEAYQTSDGNFKVPENLLDSWSDDT